MKQNIMKFLLSATLVCCSSVKASVNTEYFNMLEFSKEILDTCSIDKSSTSDIIFPSSGDTPPPRLVNMELYIIQVLTNI